ncbi:hypothetical protein [Amycolatopsis sp. cmx-4-54]|uniref:hypothetical protein n=1 Tax=Amycolatopsis sp. cmx-4-54 TaxID=2790936 RepID=UPI003978E688
MKRWVLVLVIGFGFLGVCLMWASEDSSAVKCSGRLMSYGDVCETTKGGRTIRTETYDEMKAGAQTREKIFRDHGLWVGGVGAGLTGLGATMLIRKRRSATRAGVTAPQGGYPQPQPQPQPQWQGQQQWQGQPQPGFPPQQGNPRPYANQAVQQYPPRRPGPPAQAVQQYQQPFPPQGGWPQQPPQQRPPQQFGPTGH